MPAQKIVKIPVEPEAPTLIFNPDDDLSKLHKCKFIRFDQPENVLKTERVLKIGNNVYEWKGELMSGNTYELPKFIIEFLNSLHVPIYQNRQVEGSTSGDCEAVVVGQEARFSCQVII